ncbi:MAG: hypothetical protein JW798_10680, partial [Prolixibacteraceae bacterium]|nr:hypothetical protein [Prolixibacteraceae bacterium]
MKIKNYKFRLIIGIALVLFLFTGHACVLLPDFEKKPCRIELLENWKLASSTEVQQEGEIVSTAGYNDADWHPVSQMPATV